MWLSSIRTSQCQTSSKVYCGRRSPGFSPSPASSAAFMGVAVVVVVAVVAVVARTKSKRSGRDDTRYSQWMCNSETCRWQYRDHAKYVITKPWRTCYSACWSESDDQWCWKNVYVVWTIRRRGRFRLQLTPRRGTRVKEPSNAARGECKTCLHDLPRRRSSTWLRHRDIDDPVSAVSAVVWFFVRVGTRRACIFEFLCCDGGVATNPVKYG